MEEEKLYSITLADGTKLEDLQLNGNNYISKQPVDEAMFDYNLDHVIISDGETEASCENMALVQILEKEDGTYWFILRELSKDELEKAQIRADIDYLYMMTDVDLMM